ncbi:endonuclease/exonuclease/phosphatase family protein [Streptomyces sp. NBC_01381]|uniref:endonuclease/exonuclease/phosphatase family protein n=1 Tax=Streptomyces sp. NBC_01381 TaxID=2903845 RepID=UPI00225A14DB|nr:endonuclease/exonuclease/phosphatase family protein [Streptomyces sp. NBC_01381]MCX4666047.1 endonuclease/exonuclease/phosphatase family protein [Streptomyces sp. NBC_01381]
MPRITPRRRLLRVWFTSVLSALLLIAPGSLTAVSAAQPSATLKVMTRSLYWGADLAPVFTAGNFGELTEAVDEVFTGVQDTNFPERAEALADEVADTDPQLVGLQEVALWRSAPFDFSPTPNAGHVEYDFLEILLDKLAARGKHYAAVSSVTDGDYEAPRATPSGLQDIRLTDRDVLLARTDLPARNFSVAHPQAAQFTNHVSLPNPISPALPAIRVLHGWVGVDATVHGRTTRVVSTHLENLSPAVQEAQGQELLDGPLDTGLPTVLLGDLNSPAPGGQTYQNLVDADFRDAWTSTHRNQPGFTCCQAADLRNPTSTLSRRLDYVLFRGGFTASASNRVGEQPADRTPSGLWPSDHAGVWSVLRLRTA